MISDGEFSLLKLEEAKIGVLGFGYVGLPLAVAFGGRWPVEAIAPGG